MGTPHQNAFARNEQPATAADGYQGPRPVAVGGRSPFELSTRGRCRARSPSAGSARFHCRHSGRRHCRSRPPTDRRTDDVCSFNSRPFSASASGPLTESERDSVEQHRAWQITATSAMALAEPKARGLQAVNLSDRLFSADLESRKSPSLCPNHPCFMLMPGRFSTVTSRGIRHVKKARAFRPSLQSHVQKFQSALTEAD